MFPISRNVIVLASVALCLVGALCVHGVELARTQLFARERQKHEKSQVSARLRHVRMLPRATPDRDLDCRE